MITLPEAFEQEMKQLLGEEEYEAYRKTFDEAVHRGLRVNNGKISTEEFLRRTDIPLKKVPWIPNGFYYDEESCNPAKDADYYAGLYYLQEPSAMTPASRLPIEPDDRVLDLCAAPGGKATELGSRIGEGGMLLANDISNSRAKALLRNLEIQGVGRLLVTSEDPEKLVTLYPAFFDKILLDAPCSGEGMFRKESSMLRYYSENGPEHYVPIQKKTDRAGVSDACRGRRAAVLYLYVFCKGERRGHRRAAGCASGYGSAGNYPGVTKGLRREYP